MDGNNFNNNGFNNNQGANYGYDPNANMNAGYNPNASMNAGYDPNANMNYNAAPAPDYTAYSATTPVAKTSTAGKVCSIIGFIAGLAAFVLGVCPCTYVVGPFLGLVAVVCSIIGLAKGGKKVFSIVGLIGGGVGLLVSVIWFIVGFSQVLDRTSTYNQLMNSLNY